MKKIFDWFKGAWLSFRVSQNARRLGFLRGTAALMSENQHLDHESRITLEMCCNVIEHYLAKRPNLDSSIFPLAKAQNLFQESTTLIQIVEAIVYAD